MQLCMHAYWYKNSDFHQENWQRTRFTISQFTMFVVGWVYQNLITYETSFIVGLYRNITQSRRSLLALRVVFVACWQMRFDFCRRRLPNFRRRISQRKINAMRSTQVRDNGQCPLIICRTKTCFQALHSSGRPPLRQLWHAQPPLPAFRASSIPKRRLLVRKFVCLC